MSGFGSRQALGGLVIVRSVLAGSLVATFAIGCSNPPATVDAPPTVDTDTGDDPVLLPIDTSKFIPRDTYAPDIVDIQPDDFLFLRHFGEWRLSGGFMSGELTLREYINFIDTADTIDTAPLPWVCNVEYALTGAVVNNSTCPSCDVVFDVEHVVTNGASPNACREPDAPPDGVTWQMGYEAGANRIYHNYYGTDVWVPWFTTSTDGDPDVVAFEWEATLAIELEDTAAN